MRLVCTYVEGGYWHPFRFKEWNRRQKAVAIYFGKKSVMCRVRGDVWESTPVGRFFVYDRLLREAKLFPFRSHRGISPDYKIQSAAENDAKMDQIEMSRLNDVFDHIDHVWPV